MKILIGGDLVPTKSNMKHFSSGNTTALVDAELKKCLDEADYRIVNLEVPLTDRSEQISKNGPCLIASTQAVAGLQVLGIDFCTIANNHILDQGETGLFSTINTLKSVGIAYAGVGQDAAQAAKPYVFEVDGQKIGLYCCAEHEFSIVSRESAGANPFDPLESLDHISKLRAVCDRVIVLYHGGKEHYRYPAPYLQKRCRRMVEKGADLVVCQHSHCVGCMEEWQGGKIVYGQGNFLFDAADNEYWNTGLLILIENGFQISFLPIEKDGARVKLASGIKKEQILADFRARSNEILDEDFVYRTFESYAKEQRVFYLLRAAGVNRRSLLFRLLNKLTKHRWQEYVLSKKCDSSWRLFMENAVLCEPHRELLLLGMRNFEA